MLIFSSHHEMTFLPRFCPWSDLQRVFKTTSRVSVFVFFFFFEERPPQGRRGKAPTSKGGEERGKPTNQRREGKPPHQGDEKARRSHAGDREGQHKDCWPPKDRWECCEERERTTTQEETWRKAAPPKRWRGLPVLALPFLIFLFPFFLGVMVVVFSPLPFFGGVALLVLFFGAAFSSTGRCCLPLFFLWGAGVSSVFSLIGGHDAVIFIFQSNYYLILLVFTFSKYFIRKTLQQN